MRAWTILCSRGSRGGARMVDSHVPAEPESRGPAAGCTGPARLLAAAGCNAIVPSYGYTSVNGFGMLRGGVPLDRMVATALAAGLWCAGAGCVWAVWV